jgi:hypothetical protein
MADEKVHKIIARYLHWALMAARSPSAVDSDRVARDVIKELKNEGYVIICKRDLREAVDAAAKRIAEAFATATESSETKQ